MSEAKPRRATRKPIPPISDQLREFMAVYGTPHAVAVASGIDHASLYRFANGERTLTLDTVDRIAEALGLRLVETGRARSRPITRKSKVRKPPLRVEAPDDPERGPGPDDEHE